MAGSQPLGIASIGRRVFGQGGVDVRLGRPPLGNHHLGHLSVLFGWIIHR